MDKDQADQNAQKAMAEAQAQTAHDEQFYKELTEEMSTPMQVAYGSDNAWTRASRGFWLIDIIIRGYQRRNGFSKVLYLLAWLVGLGLLYWLGSTLFSAGK